ncbi:ATP-binding protein [Streptomyces chrestomyceticus JCM 4735]|uniref:ATP-binding protein n=1 Tax=Streptomyces chrestomyceticus JCM 4735 TaxID=1306181 RepID=A0A7U9L2H0_9ACTN|nr:ATP-binding protein [Streptomyces chrestomyceticus]GCD39197.1 ATP-binding protein [Streptomyces chrestomyceticus JCM 4735]
MPLPHAPTDAPGGAPTGAPADPCVRALRMRLPTGPQAPRLARESVSAVLDPDRYALGDGQVCLSEVVANAVRHSTAPEIPLMLIGEPDGSLFAAVRDTARTVPMATGTQDEPLAEDGRGLELLGALADGWGFDRTRSGKWVWFRVRHPRSAMSGGPVSA